MSYVNRTTHPAIRRQRYLDKKTVAKREYFRTHPEEQQKRILFHTVVILGSLISGSILMNGSGWCILTFMITAGIAGHISPKYPN